MILHSFIKQRCKNLQQHIVSKLTENLIWMTNLRLVCSWAKPPRQECKTWWWSSPAPAEQSRGLQAPPLDCPQALQMPSFAHCSLHKKICIKLGALIINKGKMHWPLSGHSIPHFREKPELQDSSLLIDTSADCHQSAEAAFIWLFDCRVLLDPHRFMNNTYMQIISFYLPGLCQEALDALHLTMAILHLLGTERLLRLWVHIALWNQHFLRLRKLYKTNKVCFKAHAMQH